MRLNSCKLETGSKQDTVFSCRQFCSRRRHGQYKTVLSCLCRRCEQAITGLLHFWLKGLWSSWIHSVLQFCAPLSCTVPQVHASHVTAVCHRGAAAFQKLGASILLPSLPSFARSSPFPFPRPTPWSQLGGLVWESAEPAGSQTVSVLSEVEKNRPLVSKWQAGVEELYRRRHKNTL